MAQTITYADPHDWHGNLLPDLLIYAGSFAGPEVYHAN